MSRQFRTSFATLAIAATSMLTDVCFAAEKLTVTASFSILGDLVRVVGGDRVVVNTLVGPNQDAHVFEPRPEDVKTIIRSRLLVANGLGFEPWMDRLAKAADYKGVILHASTGVTPRVPSGKSGKSANSQAAADPHAWQSPVNVATYVDNIATALTQLDPANGATFTANRVAYIQELSALDQWIKAQIAPLPKEKRRVITSHDAFGYFADQYEVSFMAPVGVSTQTEASAKDVALLIRLIKREKIKAVFMENMNDPKLLLQLSKEAGVVPGAALYSDALSSASQPGATYLQMMRHNVSHLVRGLKQN